MFQFYASDVTCSYLELAHELQVRFDVGPTVRFIRYERTMQQDGKHVKDDHEQLGIVAKVNL